MKQLTVKILIVFFGLPSLALAHADAGGAHGFMHGFGHPIGGLDHILAMLAVGLWAAQLGKRAMWAVPCTFVAVMVLGGVLGFSGIAIPFVEAGILASIFVLGVLIAAAVKAPLAVSSLVVATFAVFHGHAHGTEMPTSIGAASYAAGFALATALLHLAGMGLGLLMQQVQLQSLSRVAGGAIALSGLYLAAA
jgi:urease accessory protein